MRRHPRRQALSLLLARTASLFRATAASSPALDHGGIILSSTTFAPIAVIPLDPSIVRLLRSPRSTAADACPQTEHLRWAASGEVVVQWHVRPRRRQVDLLSCSVVHRSRRN